MHVTVLHFIHVAMEYYDGGANSQKCSGSKLGVCGKGKCMGCVNLITGTVKFFFWFTTSMHNKVLEMNHYLAMMLEAYMIFT